MAKSKKTDAKDASAAPAKKAAGNKSKKSSPSSGESLGIDTNLVAQVAAATVSNKALLHESQTRAATATPSPASAPASASNPQAEQKESATFKQLKESLSKPGSAKLNQFLHNTASPASKKSNLPFGGGKQVGHNQTFGADVTRSGVPRRTPG